ncbi:hypothetical protein ElyMa_004323100 [Elysia marginata]|uniref:Uncharacterized protein n=1 Tax=Elysia marginata TaxID=1093978 RepID=A0AAV4H055_9GAST|nr:hypothetical protein ElyMa_004323100 [Elysia marginata]
MDQDVGPHWRSPAEIGKHDSPFFYIYQLSAPKTNHCAKALWLSALNSPFKRNIATSTSGYFNIPTCRLTSARQIFCPWHCISKFLMSVHPRLLIKSPMRPGIIQRWYQVSRPPLFFCIIMFAMASSASDQRTKVHASNFSSYQQTSRFELSNFENNSCRRIR